MLGGYAGGQKDQFFLASELLSLPYVDIEEYRYSSRYRCGKVGNHPNEWLQDS